MALLIMVQITKCCEFANGILAVHSKIRSLSLSVQQENTK